jgi:hypothetical protein
MPLVYLLSALDFYFHHIIIQTVMSGIALLGAILAVLILNVLPSVMPFQLSGNAYFRWVLTTLFIGVLVYQGLRKRSS